MQQKNQNNRNTRHPVSPTAREQRIGGRPMRLPFQPNRRKGGIADWIYRHRIGLLVTVVLYLAAAIAFVTYKIVIKPAQEQAIEVNIDELKILEELIREQEINKELTEMVQGGKVSNQISNQDSKSTESLRDSKNTDVDKMNEEIESLQQQLKDGQRKQQEALEQIERDAARLKEELRGESNINAKQGDRDEDAFVKGNVTASFSLEGRTVYYMDIPAYKCKNGGTVVVNVSVNRNGRVISASVQRDSSSEDKCLHSEAITSAKATSFNASSTAPEPQRGTITYMFVAQ